jgi:RND family efflux transporter MFP subunit
MKINVQKVKYTQLLYCFGIIPMLISCNDGNKRQEYAVGKREHTEDVNVVVTSKATRGTFYKEFENNGKLAACQSAVLNFEQTGKIVSVNVNNGDHVDKGEVLATIEDSQQKYSYEKALRNKEKCYLALEEALLNQGYSIRDSALVPPNAMKMALIRSGYQDAVNDADLARQNLDETKVIAPFSGIVADLDAKAFNETSSYKHCCTLINNREFEVSFPMLEVEMAQIEKGMNVEIVPFAFETDTLSGTLSGINPKVEENGMVEVKAQVANKNGILAEGMNVKVMVRKPLGNKVYVPKEAVTLRQERNVVFVEQNDTAYWRYVNVGETNSKYTVINENINPGEDVIIEGNFNLAHLSPVQVIQKK